MAGASNRVAATGVSCPPPAVSPTGDGGYGGKVGVEAALTYAATPSPTTTPGLGDKRDDVKGGGKVCTEDASAITPKSIIDRPPTLL